MTDDAVITLVELRKQLELLQSTEPHHRKIAEASNERARLDKMIRMAVRARNGREEDRLRIAWSRVPRLERICQRCPRVKECGGLSEKMAELESGTSLQTSPMSDIFVE